MGQHGNIHGSNRPATPIHKLLTVPRAGGWVLKKFGSSGVGTLSEQRPAPLRQSAPNPTEASREAFGPRAQGAGDHIACDGRACRRALVGLLPGRKRSAPLR